MVSNKQNLNEVGIDLFLCAIRSLGVKNDDISGEQLKSSIVMWRLIAPTNITLHQLSMKMSRMMMMRKTSASQVISIKFIKTRNHHLQFWHKEERAMFTSHPGANLIFSMVIN